MPFYIVVNIINFDNTALAVGWDDMRNGTKALSIAMAMGVVVIVIAMVGTSAFTSSTIDRDVSIGVSSDTEAIITFNVDNSDIADFTAGKLVIGVDDLNLDAQFTFGDSNDVTNDNAFAFTNTDDEAHGLSFVYTPTTSGNVQADDVVFAVYDSGGNAVTDIDASETLFVVMTIDTDGWALTDTATGTVTIGLA